MSRISAPRFTQRRQAYSRREAKDLGQHSSASIGRTTEMFSTKGETWTNRHTVQNQHHKNSSRSLYSRKQNRQEDNISAKLRAHDSAPSEIHRGACQLNSKCSYGRPRANDNPRAHREDHTMLSISRVATTLGIVLSSVSLAAVDANIA